MNVEITTANRPSTENLNAGANGHTAPGVSVMAYLVFVEGGVEVKLALARLLQSAVGHFDQKQNAPSWANSGPGQ
jgi:hypothetical protein